MKTSIICLPVLCVLRKLIVCVWNIRNNYPIISLRGIKKCTFFGYTCIFWNVKNSPIENLWSINVNKRVFLRSCFSLLVKPVFFWRKHNMHVMVVPRRGKSLVALHWVEHVRWFRILEAALVKCSTNKGLFQKLFYVLVFVQLCQSCSRKYVFLTVIINTTPLFIYQ